MGPTTRARGGINTPKKEKNEAKSANISDISYGSPNPSKRGRGRGRSRGSGSSITSMKQNKNIESDETDRKIEPVYEDINEATEKEDLLIAAKSLLNLNKSKDINDDIIVSSLENLCEHNLTVEEKNPTVSESEFIEDGSNDEKVIKSESLKTSLPSIPDTEKVDESILNQSIAETTDFYEKLQTTTASECNFPKVIIEKDNYSKDIITAATSLLILNEDEVDDNKDLIAASIETQSELIENTISSLVEKPCEDVEITCEAVEMTSEEVENKVILNTNIHNDSNVGTEVENKVMNTNIHNDSNVGTEVEHEMKVLDKEYNNFPDIKVEEKNKKVTESSPNEHISTVSECENIIAVTDCQKKMDDFDIPIDSKGSQMIGPAIPPKDFFSKKTEKMSCTNEEVKEKDKLESGHLIAQKKDISVPIEFISEYSNEGKKKKVAVNVQNRKGVEESKGNNAVGQVNIVPQILKQADSCQLEKETELYYKEVCSSDNDLIIQANDQRAVKEKPKCLTPAEIAKIAKNYPSSENNEVSTEMQASWATLHQYWTHVQENPYDFDGWTYLMNHVETMDNIEAARSAFEGFLPLYPYCFAYWRKLSDLELKFCDLEQCLGVLYNGTKSVPFCSDLWIPLLNQFLVYAKKENMSEESIRGSFEFALDNVGLAWHSSCIWQLYLDYELDKGDLVRVFDIYRRLISIPTKLSNKHWDHVLALIRDHHPRNFLSINEYFKLKKHVSEIMNIKFIPPPMVPPKHLLKVNLIEDSTQTIMKEKIVASLIPDHEANDLEVDKRWTFEDKIKRPYFHVKPLERKQLKNWKEYIEFELKQGDPVRIMTLYERCLIPCAMYEDFWCNYASFMEGHVLNVTKGKYSNMNYKASNFFGKINSDSIFDFWESLETKSVGVSRDIKFEVMFLLNRLGEGIGLSGKVLCSPSLTPLSILQSVTWDDVRQIYRRAAWIHCPSKPKLLMQWAEFEESQGNVQTARELLNNVIVKHPMYLSARLQLIELERRSEQYDKVEELYAQTFSTFKDSRIKSCIAIKYARFLFKIKEEVEKSLMILRRAMKKDKANVHLYHHVFDICYQRKPVDVHGVLAAVMLALSAKEMSLEEKNWFCVKRLDFLREHGTINQFKHAKIEAEEIRLKYLAEAHEEAVKQKAEDAAIAIKEKEIIEKESEKIHTPVENSTKIDGTPEAIATDAMKDKRKRSESPKRKSRKKERREKGEIREHRSSKRSKKSPDKHRSNSANSNNKKKRTEDIVSDEEILYSPNGTVLYDPKSQSSKPDYLRNSPNQSSDSIAPSSQLNSHSGLSGPRFSVAGSTNSSGLTNKGYNSVNPSWEPTQVVSSNYG